MSNFTFTIGSWVAPLGFAISDDKYNRAVPVYQIPRRDGAGVSFTHNAERCLTFKGTLIDSGLGVIGNTGTAYDPDRTVEEALASLRGTVDAGANVLTMTGYRTLADDTPISVTATVYCRNLSIVWERMGVAANVSFEVVMPDAYYEYATVTTVTPTPYSGSVPHTQAVTLTVVGDTYVWPTLTLTYSGALGTIAVTVTNATTGDSLTLTGALTTTVNSVDSKAKSASTGTVNLMDGEFLRLQPGANTLNIISASGPLPTGIIIAWNERYS